LEFEELEEAFAVGAGAGFVLAMPGAVLAARAPGLDGAAAVFAFAGAGGPACANADTTMAKRPNKNNNFIYLIVSLVGVWTVIGCS
jgi:hypothetical protein